MEKMEPKYINCTICTVDDFIFHQKKPTKVFPSRLILFNAKPEMNDRKGCKVVEKKIILVTDIAFAFIIM